MTERGFIENPDDDPLRRALDGVDTSAMDEIPGPQYPIIPGDEIISADEYDPLQGSLMRLANIALSRAAEQSSGETARNPKFHEDGWSLTLETPRGYVGLWSSWMGDRFYLGLPLGMDVQVPESLIMKTLGVEHAHPVKHVMAYAVTEEMIAAGTGTDPDKPYEPAPNGRQMLGFVDKGELEQWAEYFGPRLPEGGRIWVNVSDHDQYSMYFPAIGDDGSLEQIYYGHDRSNGISTYSNSIYSFNTYAPDGPTDDPYAIHEYRERFIMLASQIAHLMGGTQKLHIDYGFVMTPEDMEREGYTPFTDFGLTYDTSKYGDTVGGRKGNELVVLKAGLSLVPWSTIRRMDVSADSHDPIKVAQTIVSDALYF